MFRERRPRRSRGDPAELPLESLPDGGAARREAAGEHLPLFEGAIAKTAARVYFIIKTKHIERLSPPLV